LASKDAGPSFPSTPLGQAMAVGSELEAENHFEVLAFASEVRRSSLPPPPTSNFSSGNFHSDQLSLLNLEKTKGNKL